MNSVIRKCIRNYVRTIRSKSLLSCRCNKINRITEFMADTSHNVVI